MLFTLANGFILVVPFSFTAYEIVRPPPTCNGRAPAIAVDEATDFRDRLLEACKRVEDRNQANKKGRE
jgi:hypothetical protein